MTHRAGYPGGGGRYPGKTLVLEIPGVKVQGGLGAGNGLPAALPHACPRRKILMASHWCCSDPRAAYPGEGGGVVGIPGKLSFSRSRGKKCRGFLVRSETKIEVRNEDWPPGCLSQRLKIGTRPVYGDRYSLGLKMK